VGYRFNNTFCNTDGNFIEQKEKEEICENNFECDSNLCIDDKYVSSNLWNKFLSWLKKIFG
jgi:hypothetical protein